MHKILEALEVAKMEMVGRMKKVARPLEEGGLERVAFTSLRTKVDAKMAEKLSRIVTVRSRTSHRSTSSTQT